MVACCRRGSCELSKRFFKDDESAANEGVVINGGWRGAERQSKNEKGDLLNNDKGRLDGAGAAVSTCG
jgi:hypothetical protein